MKLTICHIYGVIIHVTSIQRRFPGENTMAYSAAKAALSNYSHDYYSIYDCSSWHSWCFTEYSSTLLFNFLIGKECEVFAALFDIDMQCGVKE